MNKTVLSLCVLCSMALQGQITGGSPEILQQMKKLGTVGSVLYVAAHPDDENTRLLTYLSKERNLRTGYLSLTRGDGGQNLIGKEQGEALGVIRTQELLAARRTDGAEQFFTRANDFGYSKTPEETLRIWNRDSILSDMVLVIRQFKPDVIICRFPTTGEGGHGHHTASAILALEAFDASADSNRYAWQLKKTGTWKAKRIFWNTFNFGTTNTTSPSQLKTDVGGYNVLYGKSYGEIAAESRSMHRSQGFGSARQRGSSIEYFKQLKGDSVPKDLFEKIDLSWKRIANGEKIQKLVDDCIRKFDMQHPEKSIEQLKKIHKEISSLQERDKFTVSWKNMKLRETEQLIVLCAGMWFEATSDDPLLIAGKSMKIFSQLIARNPAEVKIKKLSTAASDTTIRISCDQNVSYTFATRFTVPEEWTSSQPYWLKAPRSEGLYTVSDENLRGTPENDPLLMTGIYVDVEGLPLVVSVPVRYKKVDPVKGEGYQPLQVLPKAECSFAESIAVFNGSGTRTIGINIQSNTAETLSGKITFTCPPGWRVKVIDPTITLSNKEKQQLVAEISCDGTSSRGTLKAAFETSGRSFGNRIQTIDYDHIPKQLIQVPCEAKLICTDLKGSGGQIGYIPGAGDEVAECLRLSGYHVTILNDELIEKTDLGRYQAIVFGVRAYNTNERLQILNPKLFSYMNNGGNLIVQYNTNSRVGPLQARIGPYPFSITRDRVTDETAEVKFIKSDHPALVHPNRITASDFDGWVQERGIYFASDLDKAYQTVLSMHDPGEKENTGSLIIAKYGKGNFVYTGLAFFRQLPAGVPGAYRLFGNLLNLKPSSE